jgi:hypothetical protein
MKNGIDVSSHNGTVDWAKAKAAGIQFAMLRAGYGSDRTDQDDTQFARNVVECDRLGIPWGAYLYSYALTFSSAESELAHLLRLLHDKKPLYPVILDMEDADGYRKRHGMPSRRMLTDITKNVCSGLRQKNYLPGYYVNEDWYETRIYPNELENYVFWYARPGVNKPDKPCGIWQNNFPETGGSCPGANIGTCGCDTDVAYIDYPQLVRRKGLNGWTKSADTAAALTQTTGNSLVRQAQAWYNARGAGLKTDGYWGPATRKAATASVQRGCNQAYGAGLTVDGIWGPKTAAAVHTLRHGSNNESVLSLQAALLAHGRNCQDIDGIFGEHTEFAIRSFQRSAGLSADGLAGKNTFAALCR